MGVLRANAIGFGRRIDELYCVLVCRARKQPTHKQDPLKG